MSYKIKYNLLLSLQTEESIDNVIAVPAEPKDEDIDANKENTVPIESPKTESKKISSSTATINTEIPLPTELFQRIDKREKPQENILADITDNHRHESDVAVKFSTITRRGIKRMREMTIEQKKITQFYKSKTRESTDNKDDYNGVVIKSQQVPVIVKQEKEKDLENDKLTTLNVKRNYTKLNQLVWLPGAALLEPEKPKSQKNKLSNTVDCIADEAEENIVATIDTAVLIAQNNPRKTVIEKPRRVVVEKNINEQYYKAQKTRKGGSHGRIADLISNEQKEAIEKYYHIDMSVIDLKLVRKYCNTNDKKQITCKLCNISYPRVDKCHVHIWGHLDMKPYRCKACNFATVTVTNIRSHIRKSHLKIKPFSCHICEKSYVTAVLLTEHLNTHTGARPFQCKICDFTSASRQVLSYHSKTHKTIKDITCDICKKQFYTKGRIRAHMIIHNEDKSLMCKYCSHHFTNPDALQRHYTNVHSRDYVCATCGKRTKSRKALHNHQNVS